MRILLIVPPFSMEEIYPDFGKNTPLFQPLELAYTGSYLKSKGHGVDIIDSSAMQLSLGDIDGIIRTKIPDMVISVTNSPIFSLTFSLLPKSLDLLKLVKEVSPGTKTVLTGYFSTFLSREVLSRREVDFVIIGEPEITSAYLCEAIEKGKNLEGVDGLGFRKGGNIYINKEREFIKDLDKMPLPMYNILPMGRYRFMSDSLLPTRGITLSASRGCVFNCYFCSSAGFWKRTYRKHSPEYIVLTMNYIYENFKIDRFQFHDDIFGLEKEWILRFCNLLKANRYHFKWDCYSHFKCLEEERLRAMKESGCNMISLGVECANEKKLREIKGIDKVQVEKGIALLKRLRIKIRLFFLIGFPAETEKEIEDTIGYGIELDPDIFLPIATIPFPGSEFYDDLKKGGYVPDFYQYFSRTACDLPQFKKEYLEFMVKKAFRRFYLRPSYIVRELPKALLNIRTIGAYIKGMYYILR